MWFHDSLPRHLSLCDQARGKEILVEFISPSVSKAKGWKMCEGGSDEYLADFLAVACSPVPPGLAESDRTQPVY